MENMGKLKLLKGKNSEELCKIVLPPLFTFVVNSLVYWGAPLIVGTEDRITCPAAWTNWFRLCLHLSLFILAVTFSG